MRYKINKTSTNSNKYIGFIPNPNLSSQLIGRIEIMNHSLLPINQIHQYIKWGFIEIIEGITIKNNKNKLLNKLTYLYNYPYPRKVALFFNQYTCNRCKTTAANEFVEYECVNCNKICIYCRHCISMGRISSCTKLIKWKKPIFQSPKFLKTGPILLLKERHQLSWQGQLTPLQERASIELAHSLKSKSEHIIHAVCGAGKTELLFHPIFEALQRGERVCLATPRTDVVLELYPRLQEAFRHTKIQALYGGAEKSNSYHSLILATTHQLYRFENAFDCIIVDEADAFPYTFDKALQRAVRKAKRSNASNAFVTATPSTNMLRKIDKGEVRSSFIPKRFHNHPLPVPKAEPLWFYERKIKKGRIPGKLIQWINQQFNEGKPVLLFFPSIHLMEEAYPLFNQLYPDLLIVHADDPDRKSKVMQLRQEKVRGLLTTTILERGVTIKNVQVAVIGTESKIFDANALIQIAGRVGRNISFPDGEVVFFHHGRTVEMDEAIRKIKEYNKMAGFN